MRLGVTAGVRRKRIHSRVYQTAVSELFEEGIIIANLPMVFQESFRFLKCLSIQDFPVSYL